MRRDFSERRISARPFKGMGVPIGEGEPNATSTAAREETGLSLFDDESHIRH
jgi:hypothetical protein